LLSEGQFFQNLGLVASASAVGGPLTTAGLSQLLGASPTAIRRWLRIGLIEPVRTVHRFSYFGFSQVAVAKRLCGLIAGGATLAEIRRGLDRAKKWMPRGELSCSPLATLEYDGQPLVRLDGNLLEPSGQSRFDFDSAGDEPQRVLSVEPDSNDDAETRFDRALALEDAGRLDEAAEAYRQVIALQPTDPALHFNLGNVLFALGQLGEAAESYGEALRYDPHYGEAWNNLGNTYVELEAWQPAIDAFRSALRLVPGYPDAEYNLSAALGQIGWLREVSAEEAVRENRYTAAPRGGSTAENAFS
jgi:tetratricopeptide (TPR) repeat protein